MSASLEKIQALLGQLAQDERPALLASLLANYWVKDTASQPDCVLAAEKWLEARASGKGKTGCWRLRAWLIFLLLRYGGLRFTEVCALKPDALNFSRGILSIEGKFRRETPLPLNVAQKIKHAWMEYFHGCSKSLACDPSQLRKYYSHCSRELAMEKPLPGPRALRSFRGRELELAGLHPELTALFLDGRLPANPRFQNPGELLRCHIQGNSARTSARNIFTGQLSSIRQIGIMAEVILSTVSGLEVTAMITQSSATGLGLTIHTRAQALIKAPLVNISKNKTFSGQRNYFPGEIEAIHHDERLMEIQLRHKSGLLLCSLMPATRRDNFREGDAAVACFSPFGVIITLD